MIKDIFLPLLGTASDETAIESAIALASTHRAKVSALIAVGIPEPYFSEVGFVGAEVRARSYNEAREGAEALAQKTRQRLAQSGVHADMQVVDVSPGSRSRTIAGHARYSDLSIMGGRDRDQPAGSTATATFESLLMQSGRPVIVVPTGVPLPANPKRVVLAWQPSREATRVAHDILPLLTPDTHVELLIIDPEKTRGEERDGPGERIAQKLANQGVPVRIVAKPRQARSDGEDLVRYVEASDADLLAMGGYGHSRLREIILGGTTRAVLDTMSKPVFFEH
jgi:nucleotide-binding universal stress UspA family protein